MVPGRPRRDRQATQRSGTDGERPLWLFLTEPGVGPLLGRELKFRDVVAQKTQFAKLHLRNYDLMVAPDAVVRTRSMVLRLASHALICPVFGREHLGGQQLDRLAASIRREGSLALVKSIAGEKLSRSGFESFVLRGLAERGVHFAAAEGKAVWLIAVDDRYYFGFPRFNYHEAPGRQ